MVEIMIGENGVRGEQNLLDELTCNDDKQAEVAAIELIRLCQISNSGVLRFLPNLIDLVSAPESEKRWWAVRTLAEIIQPEVILLLINALEDEDCSVRYCAAVALSRQAKSEAVPALVTALGEHDQFLARLVGDALIAIGNVAVPALLDAMINGLPISRLEAVRVLAKIGDQRSIPVLFEALDEDSAIIGYWANEGLERMGVGMTFFWPDRAVGV